MAFPFPKAALDSVRPGGNPERTRRMFEGKDEDVGVAGRTFMLLCGDLEGLWEWPDVETAGETMEAEDVDDALLCEWWWCGMLRMEDTDEEVDLRPRRPPEERRYDERGVNGAGEAESRLMEPEPWVEPRGRVGTCAIGGDFGFVCKDDLCDVFCLRRLSGDLLLSGIFGDWPLLAFEPGDRARLDVSFIQFRSDRR